MKTKSITHKSVTHDGRPFLCSFNQKCNKDTDKKKKKKEKGKLYELSTTHHANYSKTSMARTSLEPWKFVRNMVVRATEG